MIWKISVLQKSLRLKHDCLEKIIVKVTLPELLSY